MPIDDAEIKRAMSHFASGVTVVTTEHQGKPYGMTVASFASVSLQPPLVLVCIEKSVKSHDAIRDAKKFGVSILSANQSEISNLFASKSQEKFTGLTTLRGKLGIPLIAGSLCAIECSLHAQFDGGDHSIFVGEVRDMTIADGAPLLYYRSAYHRIAG